MVEFIRLQFIIRNDIRVAWSSELIKLYSRVTKLTIFEESRRNLRNDTKYLPDKWYSTMAFKNFIGNFQFNMVNDEDAETMGFCETCADVWSGWKM